MLHNCFIKDEISFEKDCISRSHMTNMMLRMFVSGVDSLASDTLGTTF